MGCGASTVSPRSSTATAVVFQPGKLEGLTAEKLEDITVGDPPPLSASVCIIILNLNGFLRSRARVLAAVSECMPHKFMDQFASFKAKEHMRQRVHGGSWASSYEELAQISEKALPIFEAKMRSIVKAAGLNADEVVTLDGKPLKLDAKHNFKHLTIAPVKSKARCEEKAANEYGGDFSQIVDCVRCSIVVHTEAELLVVATLLAEHGLPLSQLATVSGDEPVLGQFVLVRLKNRYAEPLFNGYQDGLYSIALYVGGGLWTVCEVQVHLAAVLVFKEDSHGYYVRSLNPAPPDWCAHTASATRRHGLTVCVCGSLVLCACRSFSARRSRAVPRTRHGWACWSAWAAQARPSSWSGRRSRATTCPSSRRLRSS